MKKVLFICSPSISLLDTALPIIQEIKKKNYKIDMFLPKTSNLLDFNIENNLFKISKNKISNIYLIKKNNQKVVLKFKFKNFQKITQKKNYINNTLSFISGLFHKENNFINSFLLNKYINLKLFFGKKELENTEKFFNSYKFILYDVTEEQKKYFRNISKLIFYKKKISFFHGSSCKLLSNNQKTKKKKINCFHLLWSKNPNEKKFYSHQFKLTKYFITGNPKFDKSWIRKFKKKVNLFKNRKKNILLISREANNFFFPLNKKIQYLKNIKDIILDKYNFNIIVKLHPRESSEVGKKIYFKILGKENYNKNWTFSDHNPYTLGKYIYFAISFYSGVSIDLINLNIPTIEYLNINNKSKNKLGKLIFTKKKINNFEIVHQKLALPAKNINDLEKQTKLILLKRNYVVNNIKKNFKGNFKTKQIINDINKIITNFI